MKLLGALLVFGAVSWCGIQMSNTLKKRFEFYERFISALEILKCEISFSANDLKSAFENTYRVSGADVFLYAAGMLVTDGFDKAWEKAVDEARVADREIAMLLSSKLGKTDTDGQIKHIDYVLGIAQEARKEAKNKYEKTGVLYRRGSILLGIFAVLLFL